MSWTANENQAIRGGLQSWARSYLPPANIGLPVGPMKANSPYHRHQPRPHDRQLRDQQGNPALGFRYRPATFPSMFSPAWDATGWPEGTYTAPKDARALERGNTGQYLQARPQGLRVFFPPGQNPYTDNRPVRFENRFPFF
jgi:hypothetical protein